MTTTWNIVDVKRKPDTGLVFEVIYIMNFNHLEKEDRHVGMVQLEGDPTSDSFISFDQLTEETVLQWVKTNIGEEEITRITSKTKTRIEERVQRENNPEFLQGLPWNS